MLVFIFSMLLQGAISTEPGFRFQVTQKGIEYARRTIIPIVKEAILQAKLPDLQEVYHTPVGYYTVYLNEAVIDSVDLSSSDAKLRSPNLVAAYITDAAISMTGKWKYREDHWPHVKSSGTLDIHASGISISLAIAVGMTSKGEPSVRVQRCTFDAGSVDVKFHGGTSWLINLFHKKISGAIESALNDQVCNLVEDELNNDLNSILATFQLKRDIDDFCYIDYTIIKSPSVINSALFVDGKGEIFNRASPHECPSPKQELPTTTFAERMVTIWVTDYMLNTGGYAYQEAGYLQYNLTSDDIPDTIPIRMDTDFFKYFLPPLYEQYPDKELKLWIKTTKPVTFDIETSGVSGKAEGQIVWQVQDTDKYIPVLTLDAQVDLCVNVSVNLGTESELFLQIVSIDPFIQLNSSNIGDLSIDSLQRFLSFSRALIVPFANGFLKRGIPLPDFEDIVFSGFDFKLEKGYIQIHTDVNYDPTRYAAHEGERYTLFKEDEFTCKAREISLFSNLADDFASYILA